MYNKVLKVCDYETSTPLVPDREAIRRYMAYKFGNNSLSLTESSKSKNTSDQSNSLRYICPSPDSLKIRNKIRFLSYNSNGSRLYISTRDTVYLFNTQWMSLEHTLSIRSTTLLVHPKYPDVFALLLQGSSQSKPCVKVLEIKHRHSKAHKPELVTLCTVTSAFSENWYTGCWSPNGKYMALVDKEDVLQVVYLGDSYQDQKLTEESSLKLDSEAYGILYTTDHLVVYRVDGQLQVFSYDLKESFVERAHSHIVTASAFESNQNLLATGGSDHVVNVFDVASGMVCLGTFPRLEGQISSLSFSSDGLLLAWGTKDSAPSPLDEGHNIQSALETNASSGHEGDETNSPEYFLTVAGLDPYEIYYQHSTPCPVAHVSFSPIKHVIAYACDYDTFPKGGTNSHGNLVGFLYL